MPQGVIIAYDRDGNPVYAGGAPTTTPTPPTPPPASPPPPVTKPDPLAGLEPAGTAGSSPQPQDNSWFGAAKRFAGGITETLVLPALEMAASGGNSDYIKKQVAAMIDAHVGEYKKARDAYHAANDPANPNRGEAASLAFGHGLAAALPLVGPAAAHAGERIGAGDTAGGAGEAVGLLAPFGAHAALPHVAPVVGRAMEAVAPTVEKLANRVAVDKIVKVMAPRGGPKKPIFGKMAADIAPELLRDPDLMAWSKMGHEDKINAFKDDTATKLNDAYDAMPDKATLPTQPVKKAILTAIDELMVEGSKKGGTSTVASSLVDEQGKPLSFEQKSRREGTAVLTEGVRHKVDALNAAYAELDALGDKMNGKQMRKLAQSWGSNAEASYVPETAPDALVTRKKGQGWADAEQTLRDYIAERNPQIQALNARYSLMKSGSEVYRAANDYQRTNFNPIRDATTAVTGAAIGGIFGHGSMATATLGAVIAPILDHTYTAGMTSQIGVARALASFADSVKAGKWSRAQDALMKAGKTAGVTTSPGAIKSALSWLMKDESGSMPGGERPKR